MVVPVQLIDSHCHIDLQHFDTDRAAVLGRARAAGVTRMVNPSVDMPGSRKLVPLAQELPGVFVAIGVHPYDAPQINNDTLAELAELSQADKVVAIGEIGLDFYRDRAPQSAQYHAFEAQLMLATRLNLPVIIHQRDAAADTMAILRRWAADPHPPLVLHAFSGDTAMAAEAVSLGFFLGIGGPLTFKNPRFLADVVAETPLEYMMVETDAPFLSPHPFRGKRNEPARVKLVAQKVASIKQKNTEDTIAQLTANTERFFNLPPVVGVG